MMSSSSRESPQQQRNLNETKNISTILPPEITSTPFISNKTKAPSPLVTPTKRFSGPRRTYIDTKSPGYAGRLVQYNEESNRKQQSTHQERYGSPGLFPIVHLFKKEVPVISPKLKKGTVQIGTPESKGYYSPEHSRLLLEGIVRNNSILKEQNNSNEASTRSVLDALKEISRKRIHANEDYDPMDDNTKKFRKANGEGDYAKRNRVESPPSENASSPPTMQAKKRLCTIDAVLASKTSSMYANYEITNKRKTTEDSSTRVYPINKKKFNNVETQTQGTPVIVREMKRTSITKKPDQDKIEKPIEENEEVQEITSTPKPVLKVLDDKPLEVIRKNRLGALLSALSGREIPSIPMEDRRKALDQDWSSQGSDKPLVSILSPQKKQGKSGDKHVTFNLPASTEITSSSISSNTSTALKEDKKNESNSSALLNVSSSNASQEMSKSKNISNSEGSLNNISNSDKQKDEKEKVVGGFKFDFNKAVESKIKSLSVPASQNNESQVLKTKPENSGNSSSPNLTQMFGLKPESERTVAKSQEVSPGKSPTINSLGLPTSLLFNNSTKSPAAVSTSSSFSFGTASTVTNPIPKEIGAKESVSFGFGTKGDDLGKSTTSNTMASPTISKFDGSKNVTSPTFAFAGNGSFPLDFSKSSSNTVTSSTTSNAPTFGKTTSSISTVVNATVSTSGFSAKPFESNVNSPSSKTPFESSASNPGGFKFNGGNSLPSFSTPPKNSLPTTTSSSVGGSDNTIFSKNVFDTSSKTTNAFGSAPESAANSIFGSNSAPNNSFSQGSKPFAFGSSNDKSSNNTVVPPKSSSGFAFNSSQNTVTPLSTSSTNLQFSSAANTNNMFGSEKNPISFGTSTTSSFGTPNNSFNFNAPSTSAISTTSSSSLFNTPNTATFGTTSASTFGNTSNITTSTSTSFSGTNAHNFGAAGTSSFGTSSTPSFGTSSAPSFGTSSAPSFGTSSTPSFGTSSAPGFGTSSTPNFGTSSAPSFGTSSAPSFGTASTASFGTTNNPSFGTSNAPTFGNSNTPSFGINNTFGTKGTPNMGSTNTPSFGSNTPNFGTNSIPNFGTNSTGTYGTTNTPSFSTSNTGFNSTSTPSFGTVSSSSFGTTNPSFTTTKPPLFSSNPPAYGTTNTSIPAGTNNTFGATSTAVNAFGTNTSTFGTPTTSLFGATNTTAFGNATTAPGFASSFSSPSTLTAPSFGTPTSPFGNKVTNASNISSTFGNAPSTNSFSTFNSNNNQFTSVTSAPAFGTNPSNTFGNATTGGFAANSTNNAFGTPALAGSPFGSNVSSTSTNSFASNFGKKPEQPSSAFQPSSNNMFNNNASFGSGQSSSVAGQASSSGVFTFGSSNSNGPSAGVFTFGSSEPPKTFNFNAPGTSGNVPNPGTTGFNASFGQQNPAVPNMFNIGSGNTTAPPPARSRPVARARRRT